MSIEACGHSTASGRGGHDLCADHHAGLAFINIEVMEMDVQALTTIIGSLGFPIAACIACFWMLNKERDDHKAEMNKVTEAINNNTLALTTLTERLGKDG